MLTKTQKCLYSSMPALQSELGVCRFSDMDLNTQKSKFKAAVQKALQAWRDADKDKKPLYHTSWKKAQDRLTDFWARFEPQPGGELKQRLL